MVLSCNIVQKIALLSHTVGCGLARDSDDVIMNQEEGQEMRVTQGEEGGSL